MDSENQLINNVRDVILKENDLTSQEFSEKIKNLNSEAWNKTSEMIQN